MSIEERLLTVNKYSRPATKLGKVKGIVVHYVGANNQKASGTVKYFESLKDGKEDRYASAHYVIDLDGNGFRCIPLDEMAYHVGALAYAEGIRERLGSYPNNCTIGIEMCHAKEGFTEETINATVDLVAFLLLKYELTIDDLYRHYDVTRKNCPKFFVEDEKLWEAFKSKVKQKIAPMPLDVDDYKNGKGFFADTIKRGWNK